jgi:tetratricopeptide (TPR) repeat protein
MKAVFRIISLITAFSIASLTSLTAQRILSGTVYREGKPAAGVTVQAHKGSSMMTSFDGKYEVKAHRKTKWLKFTFINTTKKLVITGKQGDVFDFAFDGNIPTGEISEETQSGMVLKTHDELVRDQDREYMNEFSLYYGFYQQGNYTSAFPHWEKIYNKYPKSSLNEYIHGANIYEDFIGNAQTKEDKDKYLNELIKLYDKRIKYFGEKGYVLGRKAIAWFKHNIDTENPPEGDDLTKVLKTGYEWLYESVNEQGEKSELPVIMLLMQTTRSLFLLGEVPKETVIQNYDLCNNNLNTLLANIEDKEAIKNTTEVQNYIEELFGSSGAADCEALINIFTPQFNEKSNDVEFIKNMLRRLGRAKCDESQLFSQASEKLYELEPSAEAAFNMARRYVRRDDANRAKRYYKQAMARETDKERLANYYYEYAYFIFAKEHALQEARSYARQALDIKQDYCQALMLIGDIYVAASRSYGQDDFERSTVFWLAVDYFERARRAGSDCTIDAGQKIATYRKYFPNKEEAFFRSLQAGQTYRIGGWINESTIVRF